MEFRIKDQYLNKKVAFRGSRGKTLGQQSQESLQNLARIARGSNDRSLLDLFEGTIPSLSALNETQTNQEIAKVSGGNSNSAITDFDEK